MTVLYSPGCINTYEYEYLGLLLPVFTCGCVFLSRAETKEGSSTERQRETLWFHLEFEGWNPFGVALLYHSAKSQSRQQDYVS